MPSNRPYRYLDGDKERHELADAIRYVRQVALRVATIVPPERHYEPRYEGWSLAGLLAHLHISDLLSMKAIQLALVLPRIPVPLPLGKRFERLTEGVFRQRRVETTVRGIRANERHITELVLHLPMDRFTRLVYDPISDSTQTVEQAMQLCFLFHWQEYVLKMQKVEGISYEPPNRHDI